MYRESLLGLLPSILQVDILSTPHTFLSQSVRDVEQMAERGPPFTLADLPAYIDALRNLKSGINDREFLLEKLLVLMSRLPDDSHFAKGLQISVIDILYKDLPHPPSSFLKSPVAVSLSSSKSLPYAFRSADGSGNSIFAPHVGQAGQPYARSVPSTHFPSRLPLPDPGKVFDALLLRRPNDFVPQPGGLSSLFFAFANLIIHSIFDTNTFDPVINNTSSYLDLSIVYGNNEEQVNSIRKNDGTGHIWEDVFADNRLLFMPPSVGALAVLFSRHHNYIASNILRLNERGTFADLPLLEEEKRAAQCDELFHRARLVNTAFFTQVILTDYVGGILGLVRDGLTWRLDPLQEFRANTHDLSQRGAGNVISVEFNMLYRWHASISRQDEAWVERTFRELFAGKDPSTVTVEEFFVAIRGDLARAQRTGVRTWTFGGLTRGKDGRFSDADIARILQDATDSRAGAFRARGIPSAMRITEILGMEQARAWGICSLNEFRRFIGLKPYSSFKEWNPDPVIYTTAEKLYGDIENLELHVGLQAEETKPPIPGAGLCPGYTISRAILADAVNLTRGDRFLTVDFTPFNLTSWGYEHCMVNKADGSYGGMITKLLFCILPDHYPVGSVYAHFPFLDPTFLRSNMAKTSRRSENLDHLYDWSRPSTNEGQLALQEVTGDVKFLREYERRLSKLCLSPSVGIEEIKESIFRKIVEHTLSTSPSFDLLTRNMIIERHHVHEHGIITIETIKEVLNLIPVYWVVNIMIGLPLMKANSTPHANSEEFWYKSFLSVTQYLYLNTDPTCDWTLKENAACSIQQIMLYLKSHLRKLRDGIISISGIRDLLFSTHLLSRGGSDIPFLSEVLKAAPQASIEDIASCVFEETVPSAALFSAALASVVDYYIHADRNEDYIEFVRLCQDTGSDQHQAILQYICKALGLEFDKKNDLESDKSSILRLVLNGQVITIQKKHAGLLSWDIFSKIAPGIICSVFRAGPIDIDIRRPNATRSRDRTRVDGSKLGDGFDRKLGQEQNSIDSDLLHNYN